MKSPLPSRAHPAPIAFVKAAPTAFPMRSAPAPARPISWKDVLIALRHDLDTIELTSSN
jgi:hypothetical protein